MTQNKTFQEYPKFVYTFTEEGERHFERIVRDIDEELAATEDGFFNTWVQGNKLDYGESVIEEPIRPKRGRPRKTQEKA